MEAVYFSETLVSTYKSTRYYNPEDQHRHMHCRKHLRSHTDDTTWFMVFPVKLIVAQLVKKFIDFMGSEFRCRFYKSPPIYPIY
jgi:hypothetical protein